MVETKKIEKEEEEEEENCRIQKFITRSKGIVKGPINIKTRL